VTPQARCRNFRRSVTPQARYRNFKRSVTPQAMYRIFKRSVTPQARYYNFKRSVTPQARYRNFKRQLQARYRSLKGSVTPQARLLFKKYATILTAVGLHAVTSTVLRDVTHCSLLDSYKYRRRMLPLSSGCTMKDEAAEFL
jgi:hypothetical protein